MKPVRFPVSGFWFLLLLTGCSLDSFMFAPEPLTSYELSSAVIPDSLRKQVTFTSGGDTLYGIMVRQVDSLSVIPHPVVLYHHGNDEHIAHFWDRVELLWRCGFSVFIYDYRGYGLSGGTSESETTLLEDAEAAYATLLAQDSTDTTQIVQYGYSLGGVPAIYLATKHPALGVITESAYASGEAIVQSGTLLNIPGRYVLKGSFSNVDRVADINTKLLMLHGVEDSFIPLERHAQPLYDKAVNPKTFIKVEGAGHTTIPQTLGEQAYIDLVTAFVRGS
jgi:pimeloyl-ACP methyl ester carboxylesterase